MLFFQSRLPLPRATPHHSSSFAHRVPVAGTPRPHAGAFSEAPTSRAERPCGAHAKRPRKIPISPTSNARARYLPALRQTPAQDLYQPHVKRPFTGRCGSQVGFHLRTLARAPRENAADRHEAVTGTVPAHPTRRQTHLATTEHARAPLRRPCARAPLRHPYARSPTAPQCPRPPDGEKTRL